MVLADISSNLQLVVENAEYSLMYDSREDSVCYLARQVANEACAVLEKELDFEAVGVEVHLPAVRSRLAALHGRVFRWVESGCRAREKERVFSGPSDEVN